MLTPAQAKAAIAVNPYRRCEELERFIDHELVAACARGDQDAAWPLVIHLPDGYADVIEQVVSTYTAAGWSMAVRIVDLTEELVAQRPT